MSLAESHRGLQIVDGHVNKGEDGLCALTGFLEHVTTVACALKMEAAPRLYRRSFTGSYRALFPEESRNYSVPVLKASLEQQSVIWVNGDKFDFSEEVMRRAEALLLTCVPYAECPSLLFLYVCIFLNIYILGF